jgi:hypothetical protein
MSNQSSSQCKLATQAGQHLQDDRSVLLLVARVSGGTGAQGLALMIAHHCAFSRAAGADGTESSYAWAPK